MHVAQIAEIDHEAFEYLSWAALAGARAGDREETRLLLARLKGNSQVADARSLVRAARAAEIVGLPHVYLDFFRALPPPRTLTDMIDMAEEFWAHGDLTMARQLLQRPRRVAESDSQSGLLARIARMMPELASSGLTAPPLTMVADQDLAEAMSLSAEPTDVLGSNARDTRLVKAAYKFIYGGSLAETARIISHLSPPYPGVLGFYEPSIADMALQAAKSGRLPGIDKLLASAEFYIRRNRLATAAIDWTMQFPALSEIVVAASSHERVLATMSSRVRDFDSKQLSKVLAAVAFGIGKAGDPKAAITLLSRLPGSGRIEALELGKFLAPTYFWRDALELVTPWTNSTFEQCQVAWMAMDPAIRTGELDAALDVLNAYPDNPFLPSRSDLLVRAVKFSARAGYVTFVQHFLGLIDDQRDLGRALADVAVEAATHNSGIDARAYSQRALAHIKRLRRSPLGQASIAGEVAAAARALNDDELAVRALRTATRLVKLVRPRAKQAELLIDLAENLRKVGDQAAAINFLSDAATAVRRVRDNETRLDQLADIASNYYECGDPDRAHQIVDRLLAPEDGTEEPDSLPLDLVNAATTAGDHDAARQLLMASLNDARQRPFLPGRHPGHATLLAATAVRASEWGIAEEIARITHATAVAEVLSTLATAASDSAPELSRRWLAQGLADHLSPVVLAAAAALDSKVGPLALDAVLDRIGASNPP